MCTNVFLISFSAFLIPHVLLCTSWNKNIFLAYSCSWYIVGGKWLYHIILFSNHFYFAISKQFGYCILKRWLTTFELCSCIHKSKHSIFILIFQIHKYSATYKMFYFSSLHLAGANVRIWACINSSGRTNRVIKFLVLWRHLRTLF